MFGGVPEDRLQQLVALGIRHYQLQQLWPDLQSRRPGTQYVHSHDRSPLALALWQRSPHEEIRDASLSAFAARGTPAGAKRVSAPRETSSGSAHPPVEASPAAVSEHTLPSSRSVPDHIVDRSEPVAGTGCS